MYLNERNVTSLREVAIFADEFVLTHKEVFVSSCGKSVVEDPLVASVKPPRSPPTRPKGERQCFCCHKKGHFISDCFQLKRKNTSTPKPTSFVQAVSEQSPSIHDKGSDGYGPFIFDGLVSLVGN